MALDSFELADKASEDKAVELTMTAAPDHPPPSDPRAPTRPPAALWRRVGARLADAAAVFFVFWALSVLQVLWFVGPLSDSIAPEPWGRAFIATVIFVGLLLIYEVIYVTWNQGQTPGKERFKVRVVRRTDQGDPGLGRAAARALLPVLVWLATPLWLAAALLFVTGTSAPFNRRRAAWHDLLSRTTAVHYDRAAEEEDDDGDGPGQNHDASRRGMR
jgi:uncharacterized RDD family membrane protein YckC